jgi:aryl-alcohol dehydrogenase-like predicted oxidoreductase
MQELAYVVEGGDMNYRTLGRTGLRVSEVGFGCGNVGGLMVRGSALEQLAAVRHAMDLGINYFDTAPQYGNGQSEINLGQVLRQISRPLTVATKVTVGPGVRDLKGTVQSSVETSLRRLGRDYVDVLQLHTPITRQRGGGGGSWSVGVDDVLGPAGVLDAFEAVRSQRLAHFVGFTGLGDTDALHAVVQSGRFDVVQAYYNLLNPSAGREVAPGFPGQDFRRLIDVAAAKDMGVVVIRVMAGGALGGPAARVGYASPGVGGALVPGSPYEGDAARAQSLGFLVSGDVASVPQAAVRFGLMHNRVSTVLVGFSDENQIDEAAACSRQGPLADVAVAGLKTMWSVGAGT